MPAIGEQSRACTGSDLSARTPYGTLRGAGHDRFATSSTVGMATPGLSRYQDRQPVTPGVHSSVFAETPAHREVPRTPGLSKTPCRRQAQFSTTTSNQTTSRDGDPVGVGRFSLYSSSQPDHHLSNGSQAHKLYTATPGQHRYTETVELGYPPSRSSVYLQQQPSHRPAYHSLSSYPPSSSAAHDHLKHVTSSSALHSLASMPRTSDDAYQLPRATYVPDSQPVHAYQYSVSTHQPSLYPAISTASEQAVGMDLSRAEAAPVTPYTLPQLPTLHCLPVGARQYTQAPATDVDHVNNVQTPHALAGMDAPHSNALHSIPPAAHASMPAQRAFSAYRPLDPPPALSVIDPQARTTLGHSSQAADSHATSLSLSHPGLTSDHSVRKNV